VAKTTKPDKTQWFRDAKFGMFIHWGVYAVLGKGEWIQTVDQIQVDEYEKLLPRFNPRKFDANEWAALAKRAGMKYMTITTKHHDGFCMWDTKTTDYNVMHTPCGRDVIGEVTKAFRKAGLVPSYYYSIMDWHHPDYLPRRPWETETRPAGDANLKRYNAYMRAQIEELLTHYGRIGAVWYDGGWEHTAEELESAKMNRRWRKIQPAVLINNRSNTPEDFGTPEQYIPPTGVTDEAGNPILWENCITMTSHWWGYDQHEKTFKTVEWLIRTFVDIVSKGGNLLLNVGPKPDGTIQREFVVRLEAMGKWLSKFGEAIYGTTASPFPRLPYDYRATVKGNRLYYFVFNWPTDGVVRVPGLRNEVKKAALIAKGRPKLACERLLLERLGSAVAVFRPSHILGRGFLTTSLWSRSPFLVDRLRKGKPVPAIDGGRNLMTPAYAGDIAEWVLRSLDSTTADGQVFNAVGPSIICQRRYYEIVAEVLGVPLRLVAVPSHLFRRHFASPPQFNWHRPYSCAKAASLLGHAPTFGPEEMIRETVEHMLAHETLRAD